MTARKQRFMQHLRGCLPPGQAKQPRLYREQRWRTLFDSVSDHVEQIHAYEHFWVQETDAQNALKVLETLQDGPSFRRLHLEMTFIVEHTKLVWDLLTWTEKARSPLAPLVFDRLLFRTVFI